MGVSRVKGLGSQNPKRPLVAPTCKSGPADACTFNTMIFCPVDGLEYSVRDIDCLRAGAGLPPVTATVLFENFV
jgi:hypothetical protein